MHAHDPEPTPTVAAWRETVRRVVGSLPVTTRTARLAPTVSCGLVLAADVRAPEDLPPEPVSAMDGFAVRWEDLAAAADANPVVLPVVADLPATSGRVAPLPARAAARIMTGALVPAGADTVVEVERTDADPHGAATDQVALVRREGLTRGRNVRAVGEEVARHTLLARAGDRVGPGLVALATTLGITAIEVALPPSATVIVTGDELVGAHDERAARAPGAVRESNGAMLRAALAACGVEADVVHSGDDPASFRAVLDAAAARSDLVLTSGGIGHGAYDVVKLALGAGGRGSSRFAHVRMRPGGPQGVGRVALDGGDVPVVHLPGTPVGALVGFHLFVRPLLAPGPNSEPIRARLLDNGAESRRAQAERPRAARRRPGTLVLPGTLGRTDDGGLAVSVIPGRRLAPYGRADCLVLAEDTAPEAGADVPVLPI